MTELVTDGDRRILATGSLRLAFHWAGDRWAHSLEGRRPDDSTWLLARTIEGDPARDDPARVVSPAYQQLEFQADGPRWLALLVGQSGPHHFSAVFAVEEASDRSRISIDVADRCRKPVEALACTYQVEAPVEDIAAADPGSMAWDVGGARLTLAAEPPALVGTAEGGRLGTMAQALAGLSTDGPTRRCVYSWSWTAST